LAEFLSEYPPDNWDTEYGSQTIYPHIVYEKNAGIPAVSATLFLGRLLHSNHRQEKTGKSYRRSLLEHHLRQQELYSDYKHQEMDE
jgi:hypothetical protein